MLFKKLIIVGIGLISMVVVTVILMKYIFGSDYEEMGDKGYSIQKTCPFEQYFTQGTQVLDDGKTLVLSSGQYGGSAMYLLDIDFQKCKFEKLFQKDLQPSQFGEGMTVALINGIYLGYQLTYRENQVLKWNMGINPSTQLWSPVLLSTLAMPQNNGLREGWGLAYGQRYKQGQIDHLYATDGTSNLYVIDPETWTQTSTIPVVDQNGIPIKYLNELEIINTADQKLSRYVFANVWQNSFIYMIDLESGIAVRKWDLTELLDKQKEYLNYSGNSYYWSNAVLNGIAYYEENDTFIMTGKLWDFIFEVKLDYRDYVQ